MEPPAPQWQPSLFYPLSIDNDFSSSSTTRRVLHVIRQSSRWVGTLCLPASCPWITLDPPTHPTRRRPAVLPHHFSHTRDRAAAHTRRTVALTAATRDPRPGGGAHAPHGGAYSSNSTPDQAAAHTRRTVALTAATRDPRPGGGAHAPHGDAYSSNPRPDTGRRRTRAAR